VIEGLLSSAKGLLRLAPSEEFGEEITESTKQTCLSTLGFLLGMKSKALAAIEESQRPSHVEEKNQEVQDKITGMSGVVEKLIAEDKSKSLIETEDIVQHEMLEAAKAIELATSKLTELANAPMPSDVPPAELNVNQALLSSAMGITSAIAQLIRAATLSEQEILAKERGSSSIKLFYKKNHRWTEGTLASPSPLNLLSMVIGC